MNKLMMTRGISAPINGAIPDQGTIELFLLMNKTLKVDREKMRTTRRGWLEVKRTQPLPPLDFPWYLITAALRASMKRAKTMNCKQSTER
jgi:hypothetical protein